MNSRWRFTALLISAAVLVGCAQAPPVRVEDAWVRSAEGGQTTAGYFTLVNDSADSLVIARVEVPVAESSLMHETVRAGSSVTMREVPRIAVPPHGRMRFAPGGHHVMLEHVTRALAEGDTTGMILDLADGRRFRVLAKVRR
jgi:copper(I)-binding protein